MADATRMKWLALAATASLAASPVMAANLTPDQLTAATTASNTDLLLIYPTGGPMKSVQWSVIKSLMVTALGSSYLQVSNNLSDLGSAATARSNLGLGTAATANTGTSGTVIPFLNNANTWGGTQTFQSQINLTAAANNYRFYTFQTSGVLRWADGADNSTESGANAGSNFVLNRYTDAGTFIDTPFSLNRSTGLLTVADGIAISGAATAPTATAGDHTTTIATTQFVTTAVANQASTDSSTYAPKASPALTGTPTAPTAAPGTNTTQLATTAFVGAAITAAAPATATTSVQGVTTLATGGQVVTGTDTTHAVTPASLTSDMNLALTGHYTLPGGLIEEWGTSGSINSNSSGTQTLDKTCGSSIYTIQITPIGGGGSTGQSYAYVTVINLSSFSIFNAANSALTFYWRVTCK